MKTENNKKLVTPEQFDRSNEPVGGDKSTKNPATNNNEPFDEGQWESTNEEPQKEGPDIEKDQRGNKLEGEVSDVLHDLKKKANINTEEEKQPGIKDKPVSGKEKTGSKSISEDKGDLGI